MLFIYKKIKIYVFFDLKMIFWGFLIDERIFYARILSFTEKTLFGGKSFCPYGILFGDDMSFY